jgi:hypothetical protein
VTQQQQQQACTQNQEKQRQAVADLQPASGRQQRISRLYVLDKHGWEA